MKWFLTALLAGLFAAGPLLTSRALGTKEAYNYSLSVADAVTQFRAGHVPMLVGQTEYAFNGRVHPLRTAPALAYATSLLDLVTFRQLGFWTLQNLVLALSLVGGAASAFWALRRTTPATPEMAALLAALYVFSPAVLAAAYGMDLYMTVLTVPLIPLILAGNLAGLTDRKGKHLLLVVGALAACWLAHPPVALWMTATTVLLQAIGLCLHPPRPREWPGLLAFALLFVVLAGFAFASALTVSPYRNVNTAHDPSLLFTEVQRTFAATLQPVSRQADQLGDFQLGYAGWLLAAGALVLGLARRRWLVLAPLAVAAFLFVMTAPVPGLHRWLWEHAPAGALNLTNQWPMQRLYLPITALVGFAFALAWRPLTNPNPFLRDAVRLLGAAALGWTLWQGWNFIGRGFATRQSPAVTARGHTSGNIDLTQISYAMLATPGDFAHGVMDPAFAFRLLAPGAGRELASNWTAALPPTPENTSGTLAAAPQSVGDFLELGPAFTLQPGQRYRLTLRFRQPAVRAVLHIRGATLDREYKLPSAGGARGFGAAPGNNPALTLWTARDEPEEISIRLSLPEAESRPLQGRPFADFTFERITAGALPAQLQSLLPLRCRVTAADAGYLETPRAFIPGYTATVNGQPVRPRASPEGLLMVPVAAGTSQVEVRYAGSPLLRAWFWLTAAGWLLFGSCAALGLVSATRLQAWTQGADRARGRFSQALGGMNRRHWLVLAAVTLVAAGTLFGVMRWRAARAAVGPVRIRFVLPQGETNRQQPLLVTGRPHAGTFVYAVYFDPEHIKIGVDVWGVLGYVSDPIPTDYFADHTLVVDAGALYPVDHPAVRDLPPAALARLRNQLRVELDGQTVLDREVTTFDATAREVTVGENRIGGSSCEPTFAGEILAVERLPAPAR